MDKLSLDKIKYSTNNCAIIIQMTILPMFIMFLVLITSNNIVSSETAKQLNVAFIHVSIVIYTYYIIPLTAVVSTVKDILKFNGSAEREVTKIVFSSITEFIAVALIFCNFQLSLGLDVINFDTGIYYTATSMFEFMAISFFIFGIYLLYIELKKRICRKQC